MGCKSPELLKNPNISATKKPNSTIFLNLFIRSPDGFQSLKTGRKSRDTLELYYFTIFFVWWSSAAVSVPRDSPSQVRISAWGVLRGGRLLCEYCSTKVKLALVRAIFFLLLKSLSFLLAHFVLMFCFCVCFDSYVPYLPMQVVLLL